MTFQVGTPEVQKKTEGAGVYREGQVARPGDVRREDAAEGDTRGTDQTCVNARVGAMCIGIRI